MALYRCKTCSPEVRLNRGVTAPLCPQCGMPMVAELPSDFAAKVSYSADAATALGSLQDAATAELRLDVRHMRPTENAPGASLSLGLGIASIIFSFLCVGFLMGVPAILAGIWALRCCRREPDHYKGFSMALTGLILGVVGTLASLTFIAIMVFFVKGD